MQAQRNLVADASHELRTPIATIRANLQLMRDEKLLSPEDREALRADVIEELDELTALVGDVVELARGTKPTGEPGDVRLDEIVAAAIERIRRRAPRLTVQETLEPTLVRGEGDRIDRAVTNLLDNAAKWSPQAGTIEVALHDGELTVRDHGPGFHDEDLPFVFDRFHRARDARSKPGSGLGLAIVRQAAEAHGGYVAADNAPGRRSADADQLRAHARAQPTPPRRRSARRDLSAPAAGVAVQQRRQRGRARAGGAAQARQTEQVLDRLQDRVVVDRGAQAGSRAGPRVRRRSWGCDRRVASRQHPSSVVPSSQVRNSRPWRPRAASSGGSRWERKRSPTAGEQSCMSWHRLGVIQMNRGSVPARSSAPSSVSGTTREHCPAIADRRTRSTRTGRASWRIRRRSAPVKQGWGRSSM